MNEELQQTVRRVNSRLSELAEEARGALRGERAFNVQTVLQLRGPIEEMSPIVARAQELRRLQPEIGEQLAVYKSRLAELQTTMIQVRMMLLGQQTSVLAERTHMDAVTHWMTAFQSTR